jgi:hypothetical protein
MGTNTQRGTILSDFPERRVYAEAVIRLELQPSINFLASLKKRHLTQFATAQYSGT